MQTAAATANKMLKPLPLCGSNASNLEVKTTMWQVIIHITFLLSAVAIAVIDRLMVASTAEHAEKGVPS